VYQFVIDGNPSHQDWHFAQSLNVIEMLCHGTEVSQRMLIRISGEEPQNVFNDFVRQAAFEYLLLGKLYEVICR
jgi:hypothetical protein